MDQLGHCNCGSIEVKLSEAPQSVVACHCYNCRRAGGPYSINFILEEDKELVKDPESKLTIYYDKNTASGNTIMRFFCSSCGRRDPYKLTHSIPASPVATQSPMFPGKIIIKASLFTNIVAHRDDVCGETKIKWL
ncbi:unnamed protein product [Clonostachys byssicola]|uniref:CENP-V/GFA domain-containing protein n=1 Tax=Clonostachys byssicola TaxID=160290 RepID=A0A9N9Y248_9HYPO|nr:unnamed protein product [Clonostachys byssicola]